MICREPTGCVQRHRKFSGMSLLRTLGLDPLAAPGGQRPRLSRDGRETGRAGDRGSHRPPVYRRLGAVPGGGLQQAVAQTLAAKPVPATLLRKFTDVRIGDSTTLSLPDELAEQFPGCGGTGKAGKAAMKIQVLWSLTTGRLLQWLIEPGRASDAMSEIAAAVPPAGSLSIFDLGYFSLERFRRVGEARAYWISRLQHNTKVFDRAGKPLALLRFLRKHGKQGLVDVPVVLGEKERLACRLIAVRVPPEVAARRRQQIREKARDHGREPSQEYLDLQEWTIFVTNCRARVAELEGSGGACIVPAGKSNCCSNCGSRTTAGATRDWTPRRNGKWRSCMPN